MLARQAVKLKQKVIGKQNADGVCSAKGKNEKCAFVESASRRLQQREKCRKQPFACTQNVRKTFVLPTAKNKVNDKQKIKTKQCSAKTAKFNTAVFVNVILQAFLPSKYLQN